MVFGICSGAKRRGVVLQATEGGSFSVGNRKFKIEASGTPPPLVPAVPAEGTPVAMPAQIPTERIPRRSPLRLSLLAPATDKMVVSRSALIGLCLTAFAGGVVITLAVDRVHASASEAFTHAPDPVLLSTTPIPEPARPAPAAVTPSVALTPPVTTAPAPAAADPVVVQLPRETEKPQALAPPVARPVRQLAAAPVHPTAPRATAVQKKAAAPKESAPTEAAPDEEPADSALPAPVKKKWLDPFE
jgi:hypothetical protein